MTTEAATRQTRPATNAEAKNTGSMTTKAMTTNAREASLRPFGKPSRLWWLTILALSLVILAGIAAWVVQLKGGM